MSIFSKMIDKRLAVYQSSLLKTHFDEVENMYKQIRGWRHDYRNHIQVMKTYAVSGDLDSVTRYLDELETDLTTIDTVIKTGNKMTDAILNSKISLARSRNVPVDITADISVALTVAEIDLCIILGNLFDNAIDANLALPEDERMIRIYIEMKGSQLYMSFTNMTASKKQQKEAGKFATSKGDGHGFGLVRIDNIITRYGGYINRNSEDGAFTTEILLPQ